MKILNIVGARPNFMKIAPLIEEIKKNPFICQKLIHTGQHYDVNMSKLFFEDLGLPQPDIFLNVGSGSHAQQTAKIMVEFEKVLLDEKPDLVLVVGDVNSTIACALTAVKLNIPVAHIEAGLRSFDRSMPEEINRILTDSISDYLFTTERNAEVNLLKEGISPKKIYFVGNVMIDTLLRHKAKADKSLILEQFGLISSSENLNKIKTKFALVTLHRPSNVDDRETIQKILEAFEEIQKDIKLVYPVHPRTRKALENFGLLKRFPFLAQKEATENGKGCILCDPLGYLDFLKLMIESDVVLTDSGGIQEETTALGVPCLTLRENTERPVTVTEGSNILVGTEKNKIITEFLRISNMSVRKYKIPEKWDGCAAKRIVDLLCKINFNE